MNEMKDIDIREALKRREAHRTKPEVPTDFCDNVMQEIAPKKSHRMIWRWMAAAASVLLIISIGTMLMPNHEQEQTQPLVAKVEPKIVHEPKIEQTPNNATQNDETVSTQPSSAQVNSPSPANIKPQTDEHPASSVKTQSGFTDDHIHHAAVKTTDDVAYQDPARVDEFIAKLADFNDVNPVPLDCTTDNNDNTTVSKAYTFDDTKELDLFGRLLQVACCYDSKTPGYLLNYSHEQLFFTLKDMRKGQKYLWMAERISGDRILLTCTHSPIDVVPSTACYQAYRNKMKQPVISNTIPKDI